VTRAKEVGPTRKPVVAFVAVNSPFQALMATELAHREGWQDHAVLALVQAVGPVCPDPEVSLRQMAFVARRFPWRDVMEIPFPTNVLARLRRSLKMASQIAQHRSVDALVIGTIHRRFESYLGLMPTRRLVVLDDGMAALRRVELINLIGDENHKLFFRRNKRRGRNLVELMHRAEYFSMVRTSPSHTIIENNLAWLKAQVRSLPMSNETWLVGQPLVEQGTIQESAYLEAFQARSRATFDVVVKYFPHHREDHGAAEIRAAELNAKVVARNAPLELEPLLAQSIPRRVVGIYSTALISLREVLPPSCRVELTPFPWHLTDVHSKERIRLYRMYLAEELGIASNALS
jgi:hypothetical protein